MPDLRIGLTPPLLENVTAGTPMSPSHVDSHNIISRLVNDLDECPVCWAVLRLPQLEAHRRTHINRAIAAR